MHSAADAAVVAVMQAAARADVAIERKIEADAVAAVATAKAAAAKAVLAAAAAKREAAASPKLVPIPSEEHSTLEACDPSGGVAAPTSAQADDSVVAAALDAGHEIPLELLEVLRLARMGCVDPVGETFGKGSKAAMRAELMSEPAAVLDSDGDAGQVPAPPASVPRVPSDGWEIVTESPMVTSRPHGVSDPFDDW